MVVTVNGGGQDRRLVKTDEGQDVRAKSRFCRHCGWYRHRIKAPRLFLGTSQHILDWGKGV